MGEGDGGYGNMGGYGNQQGVWVGQQGGHWQVSTPILVCMSVLSLCLHIIVSASIFIRTMADMEMRVGVVSSRGSRAGIGR